MMEIKVLRATKLWQQAGAYSVRIQGMGRQHHISLDKEFDEHDGPETKYIVLLHDDYPIATCRFYEIDKFTVMLGRVVVLPEYRKKGLGKRTVLEAEEWIKELGFEKIKIESRINKISFYEKLGYEADYNTNIKGITFECVAMEKNIKKE